MTLSDRSAFARVGFRLVSKACSVMERLLTCTGRTRFGPQISSASGAGSPRIIALPASAMIWLAMTTG